MFIRLLELQELDLISQKVRIKNQKKKVEKYQ